MDKYIKETIEGLKDRIGDEKALLALSGGVDSAVAGVLVHEAIGDNLTCVFVDHGLLRQGERESVVETFKEKFHMNLIVVDAKDRFFSKLKGVSDPEEKRKIIGEEFIRVFEEEQAKLKGHKFLIQGTIKSDVVESGEDSKLVKSHHNVGGLPEDINFEIVEPLRELYKSEVRKVGKAMGLPDKIVHRQPFPGPGLGVRCLGEITDEKVDILRKADHIFTTELDKNGYGDKIWQYFVALPDFKVVGVIDGARSFSYPIFLRAVDSEEVMEAKWYSLPEDFLRDISKKITDGVPEVVRVLYDITDKPPATIEFE